MSRKKFFVFETLLKMLGKGLFIILFSSSRYLTLRITLMIETSTTSPLMYNFPPLQMK